MRVRANEGCHVPKLGSLPTLGTVPLALNQAINGNIVSYYIGYSSQVLSNQNFYSWSPSPRVLINVLSDFLTRRRWNKLVLKKIKQIKKAFFFLLTWTNNSFVVITWMSWEDFLAEDRKSYVYRANSSNLRKSEAYTHKHNARNVKHSLIKQILASQFDSRDAYYW